MASAYAARVDLLDAVYTAVTHVVSDLDDDGFTRRTRTAAWDVRALLFHQLCDAQRALIVLTTDAPGPADTDRVSYWAAWSPGRQDDRHQRGGDGGEGVGGAVTLTGVVTAGRSGRAGRRYSWAPAPRRWSSPRPAAGCPPRAGRPGPGRSGGSGLGLAIVASIVAGHGGSSDVISAPGQGTTIRIRLPLVAEGSAPR